MLQVLMWMLSACRPELERGLAGIVGSNCTMLAGKIEQCVVVGPGTDSR